VYLNEEPKSKKGRVLVAMSGGVDSSVAAAVLKEQGYDVVGVTMQVWDYSSSHCNIEEGNGTCCSSLDVDDARSVADRLEIPFYVINCEEKFKHTVIDDFVNSYLKGETPIPCVNCNTFLKFDHLVQKMNELQCDYLATGHYAQLENGQIITSTDELKDQTYFLFTLQPEVVSRLMFPIGGWQKSDLRAYAEKKGLSVARKKDSTGICFIGKTGYAGFIESQVPREKLKAGVIRFLDTGEVIGEHNGIHNFTIGQRKGFGVAVGRPIYVVKIDTETGTVWMGDEEHLYSSSLEIRDVNWLDSVRDDEVLRVKIRYAHRGAEAQIQKIGENRWRLNFKEKQRAVTVGQAAVFYRGAQLLGGGWIAKAQSPEVPS
jgi:tRNA-specific 2-thiouridylase